MQSFRQYALHQRCLPGKWQKERKIKYKKGIIYISYILQEMAIYSYDIVSTLQALGMMKYWKGKHIVLRKQVSSRDTVKFMHMYYMYILLFSRTGRAGRVRGTCEATWNLSQNRRLLPALAALHTGTTERVSITPQLEARSGVLFRLILVISLRIRTCLYFL